MFTLKISDIQRQLHPCSRVMSSDFPAAYFQTVFDIEASALLQSRPFSIVTSYNPMDEPHSESANKAADTHLKAILHERQFAPFRAIGCSPDGSHSEPGWAFVSSLEDAVNIARSFNQRALWRIEMGKLYLVDCRNPTLVFVDHFANRLL